MTAAQRSRQPRQVVRRDDGSPAVQGRPPRADVLYYPRFGWTTVLVRRTHDLVVAEELAVLRWALAGLDDVALTSRRVGWWRTWATTGPVPDDAAVDWRGRVVQRCGSDVHAAGPGIEFRPDRPVADPAGPWRAGGAR